MNYTNIDTRKKYVKMNKDVYEHLANTFLEKKANKRAKKNNPFVYMVFLGVVACSLLFLTLSLFLSKKNIYSKSLYVAFDKSPVVINYDFNSLGDAKTKAIAVNLNNADLRRYKFLNLSIRTAGDTKSDSSIKIEIENSFLEKDAEYLSGINSKWKKFSVSLSNFGLIKNWSLIKALTFVIEDWNVSNRKDRIYIDEVCFVE